MARSWPRPPAVVVLAAGQGTRMKSSMAKVLHPVGGRPMGARLLGELAALAPARIIVVVGYQAEAVRAALGAGAGPGASCGAGPAVSFVVQEEQRGTGHAVLAAADELAGHDGPVVVVNGDLPLLGQDDVAELIDTWQESGAPAVLLTVEVEEPGRLGRIVRDERGRVARIVEAADATPREMGIGEINVGAYCFTPAALFDALRRVKPSRDKGEYYLVDVVELLVRDGQRVLGVRGRRPERLLSVNSRAELAAAEAALRKLTLERLMAGGVTVIDPATTLVEPEVEAAPDVTIGPFTIIRGRSRLLEGCEVGPGAVLINSTVGRGARVVASYIEDSVIGDEATVGPYSHLRPNTTLESRVKVGNFAELKNSVVKRGAKVSHHSYIGDTDVGAKVNIGAGTVTVNYDGAKKHRTVIGDGAFIGCNANLIAPVTVGEGAYVAAGSTITAEVPGGALGVARARQENKPGWVERRRQRLEEEKRLAQQRPPEKRPYK
jgi:bifunctional UDP-N-acetylglucosamine pyrophosphorylase/glucosamine-1-phosphate N-acetyltransferase